MDARVTITLSPRSILYATLVASVVVALLVAAYDFSERWSAFSEARSNDLEVVTTMECGARLPEELLKSTVNPYSLYELGKTTCASRPFTASPADIVQARNGAMRRKWLNTSFDVREAAERAWPRAAVAFVLVNLLGVLLFTARTVLGWIASGFRSG